MKRKATGDTARDTTGNANKYCRNGYSHAKYRKIHRRGYKSGNRP